MHPTPLKLEYIYCIGSQCSGKNNHVSECSNHTFNQIHLLYFQNTYHRVLNSTETITKSNASTNASNFPDWQKSSLYHNHHNFNLSGHIVTLQLTLCRAKPNQAFVWQPELHTCNQQHKHNYSQPFINTALFDKHWNVGGKTIVETLDLGIHHIITIR